MIINIIIIKCKYPRNILEKYSHNAQQLFYIQLGNFNLI